MNVGELQRKLSLWAAQDEEHRFFDLYHLLYDADWLRLAHDYVAQNAGSKTAGCDGVGMGRFDENLEANLQALAEDLKSQTFEPAPVRRVFIPKANGKVRPLGIPTVRDRIVQEALRMILEPIYEADFSPYSFGFRPNRRTMDAVQYLAGSTIGTKRYYWVIEGDISSYFDTVCHRKLMKLLRRRIADEKLLTMIWKFLRAGVMDGTLVRETALGVPQGGIVSPLLANIYLHELDQYMSRYCALTADQKRRRRLKGEANFLYARYADDFVVLCNGTRQQAEAMKEELLEFLATALRLSPSKEKTKITHLNDGFIFLGFEIRRCRAKIGLKTKVLIPEAAMTKARDRIALLLSPSSTQMSVNAKILGVNRFINGWCGYYQYTSKAASQFDRLRQPLFWGMAHWLGRKYRLRISQVMARFRDGNTFRNGDFRLRELNFPTRRYRSTRIYKPNPYLMVERTLAREDVPAYEGWTGWERRPGMADLRPEILSRDENTCQLCSRRPTADEAQIDHLRPVRRFKRPIDANTSENLWTLCIDCHREKTEADRRMESPLPRKGHGGFGGGSGETCHR